MTIDQLFSVFLALFSDQVVFPLLQLYLVFVFVYAFAKESRWFRKKSNLSLAVKRGEKSWDYFHVAYGIALLILVEVVGSTEALTGHKTLISVVDIVILTYLAFFNSWFRNKIMGFIVASQKKEEQF